MPTRTIDVEHLHKVRESAGSRFTLNAPLFHVMKGEFVAIVGASGCGKSTLMDMIALVLRPSSAEKFEVESAAGARHSIAELWSKNDEDHLSAIRRDVLGYVLQTGGLFPYLTIRENIDVPRKLKNLGNNETMLRELSLAIGLGMRRSNAEGDEVNAQTADISLLSKKPRHLSGGQRQRSAILRALMSEPTIILADEPTAAVDEITGRSIIEQFKIAARSNNVSVVMVTHDRHLARGNVDRAYTFELKSDDIDGHITSTLVDLPLSEL